MTFKDFEKNLYGWCRQVGSKWTLKIFLFNTVIDIEIKESWGSLWYTSAKWRAFKALIRYCHLFRRSPSSKFLIKLFSPRKNALILLNKHFHPSIFQPNRLNSPKSIIQYVISKRNHQFNVIFSSFSDVLFSILLCTYILYLYSRLRWK